VEKPADRKRAQLPRRERELLADLNRAHGDAPRVFFRRLVLLCEPLHQGVHASAEERFLFRNELSRAKVAHERPRLDRPTQVDRDGGSDDHDPDKLEAVAEPPAEVGVIQEERGRERCCEPANADHDCQVGDPLRQQVGLQGPEDEQGVEERSDDESDDGRRTCGLRDCRNKAWHRHADDAEPDDADEGDDLENEEGTDALRSP
jgi:hypothetical protein